MAKDRVLPVERRLLFQRDEPLAVGSIDVVRARGAECATLVRDVTEFRRHVRIRRIACAPHCRVTPFRLGITALNNAELRIDTMDRRAVIEMFVDEFLEPFNHLRRDVWIQLDHYAPIIPGFNYGDL